MQFIRELLKTLAIVAVVLFAIIGVLGYIASRPPAPVEHWKPDPGMPMQAAAPIGPRHFERVGVQGNFHFVRIDAALASDRETYRQAIAEIAGAAPLVKILFWSDRTMIPARLPMSDEEAAAQVADYSRNRNTGRDRLLIFARGSQPEQEFSPP